MVSESLTPSENEEHACSIPKNKICCNAVIWNKEAHLSMKDIQSSITITWIGLTETSRADNLSASSRDQLDLSALRQWL